MARLTARSRIFAAEVGIVELSGDSLPVIYSGSITPSAASLTITIATGLNIVAGDEILIETADGSSYVITRVHSYNSGTGGLFTRPGSVFGGVNASSWIIRRAPLRVASVAFSSTSGTYAPASYISGLEDPPLATASAYDPQPDGQRFYGVVAPSLGAVSWVNGGRWDFLRRFTCEGQPVRMFEVPVAERADGVYVAAPRNQWVTIQDGRGLRMEVTETKVTVTVADLTEFLAAPVQRRRWEGLGGCVRAVSGAYGEIPYTSAADIAAGDATLALVIRYSAADIAGNLVNVDWIGGTGIPYRFRINGGVIQARLDLNNGGSPSTLTRSTIAPTVDTWYAIVIRWDKSEGLMSLSTKALDGLDSPWVTVTQAGTAGLDIWQNTTATAIRFLTASHVGSMIADFRAWSRHLADSELELTVRDLDIESTDDMDGAVTWISFDERYGDVASDSIGELEVELFAGSPILPWDTSGTGRPEMRGTLRPIAFGACWAPMVQVDELQDGRVYAVSARAVDDIVRISNRGVFLAPTLTVTGAAVTFGITARRIRATTPPGQFMKFVPDMEFTFTGTSPDGKNDGTYLVDGDLTGRDRIFVDSMTGPSPSDGAYVGDFASTQPEWEIYRAGTLDEPDLVKILVDADGPFHAYVSGDMGVAYGATQGLFEILGHVLVEHGKPGLTHGQIDTTGIDSVLRNAVIGFAVGSDSVSVQQVCEWIMASCAGLLVARGDDLVALTIPIDTEISAPDAELRQVIKLDFSAGAFPSSIELLHSPVFEPLSDPVGGSWQRMVTQYNKENQQFSVPMPTWIPEKITTAAPSQPIQTVLRGETALRRLGELLKAGILAEVYPVEFGIGADGLDFGDTASATFPRFGFDDGRAGYVVQWERNAAGTRATRLMLAVPRGS